jgi:predicted dehydrogenase
MHVWAYVSGLKGHPRAEIVGIWDDDMARGNEFATKTGLPYSESLEGLIDVSDAVVITSENNGHTPLVEAAAKASKHILCEKPLIARKEDGVRMEEATATSTGNFMTAFPCRFSPAYQRLAEQVRSGAIGKVRGISATNRGMCPWGWFVEPEKSGGGAMIDHVVHVTDLLRNLLQEDPALVQAQIGNNMYGREWDDTAMLTMEFPSGVFATLDSSWSRPPTFKTWGDVTMSVTGDDGVIEMDMFGSGLGHYHEGPVTYSLAGFGTDLDAAMTGAFVEACLDGKEVPVTLRDGLQASRVALAGYESARTGRAITFG